MDSEHGLSRQNGERCYFKGDFWGDCHDLLLACLLLLLLLLLPNDEFGGFLSFSEHGFSRFLE